MIFALCVCLLTVFVVEGSPVDNEVDALPENITTVSNETLTSVPPLEDLRNLPKDGDFIQFNGIPEFTSSPDMRGTVKTAARVGGGTDDTTKLLTKVIIQLIKAYINQVANNAAVNPRLNVGNGSPNSDDGESDPSDGGNGCGRACGGCGCGGEGTCGGGRAGGGREGERKR